MKKIFTMLLVSVFVLSFVSCSKISKIIDCCTGDGKAELKAPPRV
ncbi:hypothetical protein AGMMS49571_11170 [Endomicrobiia bacterium]|nr:hypothetical protein AGMMS49571_11170 [Endomicrobiia bacterium]